MASPTSRNINMSPRAGRRGSSRKSTDELENALVEKDSVIASMAARIDVLEKQAAEAASAAVKPNGKKLSGESVQRRVHPMTHVQHIIGDTGRREDDVTRGSTATANVLQSIANAQDAKLTGACQEARMLARKFLDAFADPATHAEYLTSQTFASELLEVCDYVSTVFEPEPRCVFLQSPCYVIGDIHGNLEDLHFFADNLWKLGMDLTAGQFLFLGDYVDRGKNGIECTAYLLALKTLFPHKIFMLRGNHEVRDVNGWEEHYGDKSLVYQCKERFGHQMGMRVWEQVNCVFDRLPLSGVIDHDIFCIHGGIPRQVNQVSTEVEAILDVSNVASVMPPAPHETEDQQQVCLDCLWSDPAPQDMERDLDSDGFGESPRGGGAICFGNTAIDNFLRRNQLSYIIRAHEAHAHGVSLSKNARVFTVFSTSKDHRQGNRAMAGCVLVDCHDIKVITRSHKYKNKYTHRRSSVSVQGLPTNVMETHKKLGLIRYSTDAPSSRDGAHSSDDEEGENVQKFANGAIHGTVTASTKASNAQRLQLEHERAQMLADAAHLRALKASSAGGVSGSPSKQRSGSPGKDKNIFQSFVPAWLSDSI